jgi:hypothetical protein
MDGHKNMTDWLHGHTPLSRLDVYRDSLIFAVHAVSDPTPADLYGWLDRRLDIYDRDGEKLWADVPLPGLLVLRTEHYLYILETMPPDGPWTIGRYEFRTGAP